MNTASLELCKELFALCGWKETDYFYQYQEHEDASGGYSLVNPGLEAPLHATAYPAYDLGYLLRRLPQNSWVGYIDTSGQRGYAYAYTYAWNEKGTDTQKIAGSQAATPEDAACKLAIELFQQGGQP